MSVYEWINYCVCREGIYAMIVSSAPSTPSVFWTVDMLWWWWCFSRTWTESWVVCWVQGRGRWWRDAPWSWARCRSQPRPRPWRCRSRCGALGSTRRAGSRMTLAACGAPVVWCVGCALFFRCTRLRTSTSGCRRRATGPPRSWFYLWTGTTWRLCSVLGRLRWIQLVGSCFQRCASVSWRTPRTFCRRMVA